MELQKVLTILSEKLKVAYQPKNSAKIAKTEKLRADDFLSKLVSSRTVTSSIITFALLVDNINAKQKTNHSVEHILDGFKYRPEHPEIWNICGDDYGCVLNYQTKEFVPTKAVKVIQSKEDFQLMDVVEMHFIMVMHGLTQYDIYVVSPRLIVTFSFDMQYFLNCLELLELSLFPRKDANEPELIEKIKAKSIIITK